MSMARTVQVVPEPQGRVAPARRTRVVVKRVGPWSVFRFSLLFYFCVLLIVWFSLIILYNFLGLIGVLDSITNFFQDIWDKSFELHGFWIFSRLFAVGLVMVVFGSVVNLCLAFLYNLISDFVGGIELTLQEHR
jgi:hypothetical protein